MINEKRFSILSYPNNLVIGITMVAALFSFLYIGQKSIWLDEATSISIAKLPWEGFWERLSSRDLNQGLYYFLLRFWVILGESESVVRALSALFAIASIPVLYALAKRMFGVRAGLITSLLISVNAFFIEYAQEARGYSLVFFLVVLSSYLFVLVTENFSNKKMVCGYIAVSALAVYAHFFAALVLIAQTLSVPFLPSNKIRARQLLLTNLAIATLSIPIALFILTKDSGQISWIPKPSISLLKGLFTDLSGDAGQLGRITSFYLLACIISFTHALSTFFRTGRSIDTWRYAFISFWLIVPIGISFIFSFTKPVFINKYLIVSLPGLVLLAGVGVSLIEDKYCYFILLILLLFFSCRSVISDYYPKEKENYKDSASYVVTHAKRGDGILFYPKYIYKPFEYYLNRLNTPLDLLDRHYSSKLGHHRDTEDRYPDLTIPYLESLKYKYEQIWIILRHENNSEIGTVSRNIVNTVNTHFQLKQEKNYYNVRVLQFVKK